jgi:hypothetical protein
LQAIVINNFRKLPRIYASRSQEPFASSNISVEEALFDKAFT